MIGITEASAAISGIKAAFGIAKGMSALKSETDINLAIIEIQRTLLEAQDAALEDKETIATLRLELLGVRAKLDKMDAWNRDKLRYTLTESTLGAFTYNLRPEMAEGEAAHRLCVTCYNNDRKSVLHVKAKHSGGELVHCGFCKVDLTLAPFSASVVSVGRRSDRSW